MYKVKAGENSFDVQTDDNGISVNGAPFSWDLALTKKDTFHILYNNRSYEAEIVHVDNVEKSCDILINGRLYSVTIKDRFDLLLEKMGLNNNQAGNVQTVKAPMPGLIIEFKVREGDTVKKGDPILVLEAMKMENIIKSPADGVVKTVKVKKGESVEKNQVLIEF